MTFRTEQILDLHARCLVLKRILDKKVLQHGQELDEIESVKRNVQEGDVAFVEEYKRQIIEKREEVGLSKVIK